MITNIILNNHRDHITKTTTKNANIKKLILKALSGARSSRLTK